VAAAVGQLVQVRRLRLRVFDLAFVGQQGAGGLANDDR